jgi:hypothetical protein
VLDFVRALNEATEVKMALSYCQDGIWGKEGCAVRFTKFTVNFKDIFQFKNFNGQFQRFFAACAPKSAQILEDNYFFFEQEVKATHRWLAGNLRTASTAMSAEARGFSYS